MRSRTEEGAMGWLPTMALTATDVVDDCSVRYETARVTVTGMRDKELEA